MSGILSGYRALDFTDYRCYFAGRILADLGADVIKVEPPGGDPGRNIAPFYGEEAHPERSLYWYAYNLGKKGITLNLNSRRGQELLEDIVSNIDFIVESFQPGYMDSLNVGYPKLKEINAGIIHVSITPFGNTGPLRNYKGSDITCMAMGGFMNLTGDADRAPLRISFPTAFLLASAQAIAGLMIAQYHRQRTGKGQFIDVSAQEAVANTLINAPTTWEFNNILFRRVGQGWYRGSAEQEIIVRVLWPCRDGNVAFMLFGGTGIRSNRALLSWMDEEKMSDDFLKAIDWETFDMISTNQEFIDIVESQIERFFLSHTKKELHEEAQKRGIFLQPVATAKDIMECPQLKHRGFWIEVPHDELNTSIMYPGSFGRVFQLQPGIIKRPPLVGEHNDEIYSQVLGLSSATINELYEQGVI